MKRYWREYKEFSIMVFFPTILPAIGYLVLLLPEKLTETTRIAITLGLLILSLLLSFILTTRIRKRKDAQLKKYYPIIIRNLDKMRYCSNEHLHIENYETVVNVEGSDAVVTTYLSGVNTHPDSKTCSSFKYLISTDSTVECSQSIFSDMTNNQTFTPDDSDKISMSENLQIVTVPHNPIRCGEPFKFKITKSLPGSILKKNEYIFFELKRYLRGVENLFGKIAFDRDLISWRALTINDDNVLDEINANLNYDRSDKILSYRISEPPDIVIITFDLPLLFHSIQFT